MRAFNLQNDQPPPFPDAFRVIHSAVLSRTSLEGGNNKFYVLEVHEADGKFRLFTNYGRVGTDGIKEGRYGGSREEVVAEYQRLLKEKTAARKGYLPVEVEKAIVGSQALRSETGRVGAPDCSARQTRLAPDIADFIERIYDESKAELVRRIETPLGSLSKAQIERGADTLRELRFAITRGHKEQIVPLSGQYYSLIPHRLGRWSSLDEVAIGTIEKADNEEDLLQLMRDVYHVQGELEAEVDRKYRALGAQLSVVGRDDPNYRRIERQVLDTQSHRHPFKLKVSRILQVQVPEERMRYEAEGTRLGNVRTLFHGTKNCNMVGILSRGLLIAPKNAPVTGYMFGKGIYFADQSTKSAQYVLTCSDSRRPTGYLFLADVALGRIKPESSARYREEAPRGYDSVQGCKGVSLVHNEFIIYRTAQCTLRFIAEIGRA